jgi:RNA polymerase sigma factor (sigma-70 family)
VGTQSRFRWQQNESLRRSFDVVSEGETETGSRHRGEALFLRELGAIDRAIAYACWRGSLKNEEAEDFGSFVKLRLIEKDYSIIQKYDGRASFTAFISIVVQRLLLDYRISQWGKWHASAEAKRIGEPAITIEALLFRDGRSMAEIVPLIARRWPELTRAGVEAIAMRLPSRRPRFRSVALDLTATQIPSPVSVESAAFESDRSDAAQLIAETVRSTMHALDTEDRLIFRLRFEGGLALAEIARVLRLEQKPLYRRLQRSLKVLRDGLEAVGICAADAAEVLTSRDVDLDFGFLQPDREPGAAIEDET